MVEYHGDSSLMNSWEMRHSIYATTILPWMAGRWDDDQMFRFGEKSHVRPEKLK